MSQCDVCMRDVDEGVSCAECTDLPWHEAHHYERGYLDALEAAAQALGVIYRRTAQFQTAHALERLTAIKSLRPATPSEPTTAAPTLQHFAIFSPHIDEQIGCITAATQAEAQAEVDDGDGATAQPVAEADCVTCRELGRTPSADPSSIAGAGAREPSASVAIPVNDAAERRIEKLLAESRSASVADAMRRSEPHVKAALALGRSMAVVDPGVRIVSDSVAGAHEPECESLRPFPGTSPAACSCAEVRAVKR